MNEPLKHKLFSVYGLLLKQETLELAWKKVKENRGCAGIDKVSIQEFEENLDENLSLIFTELKTKTYKPSPVQRKYIPKKNGKRRPLGIPTIKDRIIQQALKTKLEPFFEETVFHDNSCGFRPNRDAELVLKKIITRLDNGYVYIYDFD
ncbi:MAG: reverse transcriptase domain-containing protein, partial [Phocaeicola sp.]